MSYRLNPDVIVAAKVIDSFQRSLYLFKNTKEALENTYISVNACLTMQDICKNMGVENVFTGSETKENWDLNDYKNYIKSMPQYFCKSNGEYYKVKFNSMLNDSELSNCSEDMLKSVLKDKLLVNSYSDRMLGYLGL